MPRNVSAALLGVINSENPTFAYCCRLVRRDGLVMGFTSFPDRLTIGGIYYDALTGIAASDLKQATDGSVDNLDIQGILSDDRITDSDLRAGVYDGAALTLFVVNYKNLSMGQLTYMQGTAGEITIKDGFYLMEVRSTMQLLLQQFGDVTSATCRVRKLGDWQCKVNVASYRFTKTLYALADAATLDYLPPSRVTAINCGNGGTVGAFAADNHYSGGTAFPNSGLTAEVVDVSNVPSAAPADVYRTERHGNFTYTLSGFTPGGNYYLRLHFAETKYPPAGSPTGTSGAGMRLFAVYVNNLPALLTYDIFAAAGGKSIARVEEFNVNADGAGNLAIRFVGQGTGDAKVDGIEVLTNPEGGAVGTFPGIVFADTQATGYYDYGTVTFTTGVNAGFSREVKTSIQSGGYMTCLLQEGFPFLPNVGDSMIVQAGCDRNWSTCDSKFHNTINFHGEPFLPGTSKIMSTGRGS